MPAKGTPRAYHSPVRVDSARRTRAAVVEAASRLFVEQGYAGTSFAAVAAAAGVSRATATSAFDSKAALLSEVLDQALAGDDEPVVVRDRPWFQPVWQAETAEATLAAYAHACVVIGERAGPLVEALHRAADSTPDLDALWQRWLDGRRAGAAMVVAHPPLGEGLRAGLSAQTATDVLGELNNPDLYVALVGRARWTQEAYEEWLGDSMCRLLLG